MWQLPVKINLFIGRDCSRKTQFFFLQTLCSVNSGWKHHGWISKGSVTQMFFRYLVKCVMDETIHVHDFFRSAMCSSDTGISSSWKNWYGFRNFSDQACVLQILDKCVMDELILGQSLDHMHALVTDAKQCLGQIYTLSKWMKIFKLIFPLTRANTTFI